MTHRRHRHGGKWINDKAREHHEPDPEATVLQKKVDDQAKTLTKHSRTMTIVQGLLQVLAIKAGVDPAQVQEVIDRCNSEAGTSDEEAIVRRAHQMKRLMQRATQTN
ncbi:hypothetical protein RHGRI_007595 [Rhododendron griersonianum]|uniref:ANTAR domain-containing protein n=1 Tax=Rhododendron griersonianum TaxID=479676 RepID=A0AAV6KYZ0_9ERIC|nr:hypothetical protein RHGRI_007595 [Rhododendron griersonianum]